MTRRVRGLRISGTVVRRGCSCRNPPESGRRFVLSFAKRNIGQFLLDQSTDFGFASVKSQCDQQLERLVVEFVLLGDDLPRDLFSRPLKPRGRSCPHGVLFGPAGYSLVGTRMPAGALPVTPFSVGAAVVRLPRLGTDNVAFHSPDTSPQVTSGNCLRLAAVRTDVPSRWGLAGSPVWPRSDLPCVDDECPGTVNSLRAKLNCAGRRPGKSRRSMQWPL